MELYETKKLCTTKEMVTRVKRKSTEWEYNHNGKWCGGSSKKPKNKTTI
jgi:hypothetical protein